MNRAGKIISFPGMVAARPGIDVFGFYEDFIAMDIASHLLPGWVATHTGNGAGSDTAITLLDEIGGGIKLAVNAGTVADNDGINLCMDGGAFVPTAGTTIFWETKFRIDGCETSPEINFLAGLCAPAQTAFLAADGALADVRNAVFVCSIDGFSQIDANSTSSAITDQRTTDVFTLEDDTFTTFGLIFEGNTKLRFLINNELVHVTTTADEIPIGAITPIFGILSAGTEKPELEIKYVQCWQTLA